MFNTVRLRLTLWYVLIFGSLLMLVSIFVYFGLAKNLRDRFDHSLANSGEIMAAAFLNELNESKGDAKLGASEALRETLMPETYTAIFDDSQLLAANYPETQKAILPQELLAALQTHPHAFANIEGFGEEGARLVAMRVQANQQSYVVTVVESLDDMVEHLKAIRRFFYFSLPAALFIAGCGGFLLAKKSLTPVLAMSNQARSISAKNLHERLDVANSRDELGQLAETFNELLSRLDYSFETMREFMADASHELRTPLAIIRGEADVALSQDRQASEYKEALAIIQDEARILSRLVDDMLALARADAGERQIAVTEFYLNDLVEDCCRAAQVLAVRKNIALTFDAAFDLAFCGDEDMMRRMILNLLDNAIKYTPAGGSVALKLDVANEHINLTVADTGIGIAAEACGQIFERFYRVDKTRSRAEGGSGLGLAIAKWVAEAHNGSIHLVSNQGQGSVFTVSLPRQFSSDGNE